MLDLLQDRVKAVLGLKIGQQYDFFLLPHLRRDPLVEVEASERGFGDDLALQDGLARRVESRVVAANSSPTFTNVRVHWTGSRSKEHVDMKINIYAHEGKQPFQVTYTASCVVDPM